MHIKCIRAKNFLSIGEPIEIDFTKHGNIINIKGENWDQGPGASNGAGKCWKAFTPILMYDGTIKNVQEIKIGDLVMGDDSTPRMVLKTHSGNMPMYKVIPSKGDSYIVNELHTLVLKSSDKKYKTLYTNKYHVGNGYFHIPVNEYLKQSKTFKHLMRGYRTGVNFSSREVKIDPYFLGAWLGDGTSIGPHITTMDKEIIDVVYQEAKNRNLEVSVAAPNKKASTYRIKSLSWRQNSILKDLKSYNLLGNKHIPHDYKANSREIRLQVLAGLLDTDGYSSKLHGYDFINKNKILVEDVVYLARSLGFAAYIKECKKGCQTGAVGTYYRVSIQGNCNEIPVKIPRKKCQSRKINKDHLVVGIKIESLGDDDYYGFQVDGNGLFLLGDFTVVHNSTIIEAIVYGLFGDLMKGLNKQQAIHIKATKGRGLEVELHFDLDGHEYKIIRRRRPDELEFWKDGVDESKGGIPATQEEINKAIKLNYTAFINVACFGQHNTKQFLACKLPDKRAIAENLLSLDKYNKYCDSTKKKLKDLSDRLKYLATVYEKSLQDVAAGERQVKQLLKQQDEWKAAQLNAIERLKGQIEKAKAEMVKLSGSSPSNSYEKLQAINEEIEQERAKKQKLVDKIALAVDQIDKTKDKSQNHLLVYKEVQFALNNSKKEVDRIKSHNHDLLSKKGGTCPVCYSVVDPSNFKDVLKHNDERMKELMGEVEVYEHNLKEYKAQRDKVEGFLTKLKAMHEDFRSQEMMANKTLRDLESRKTVISAVFRDNASSASLLLEQQISHLNEQVEHKQDELFQGDPYGVVLEDTREELEKAQAKATEFRNEIANLEGQAPYYKFWVEAFGDKGIRSFVLGEIMPILNARINYWLQFLVDNKIRLNFNNELEECIERNPPDGDPFVYAAMSGGEHQRIDLGIALAFAQVMMLTANTIPSLVCLDEVGTNLDRPGIQAVYNTICELSRDRQVLVTTHDPDLLEMLAGYDTIMVVKQDGYTRLQN